MTMARLGRWVRRSRRAIATAQLLAFAGALVFQGAVHAAETDAPASAVRAWNKSAAQAHNVLTCAACTLLRTPARLPDDSRIPQWGSSRHTPSDPATDAVPQRVAEQTLFSRAPPLPRA